MLKKILDHLPISPAHARDLYVSRAAIEARREWTRERGKESVAVVRDDGSLHYEARAARGSDVTVRVARGSDVTARAARGSEANLLSPRSGAEAPGVRNRSPRNPPARYVPNTGQPDPTGVSNPAELQQALQAVHIWGGSPSLREIERRSRHLLRRSTISNMLRAAEPLIPDYDRYLAFLQVCGLSGTDLDPWVFVWRRMVASKQSSGAADWMSGVTAGA